MGIVINIFAPNVEKEAKALIKFMDKGDLQVELLKLEADLKGASTRPCSSIQEMIIEQINIVKRAMELI